MINFEIPPQAAGSANRPQANMKIPGSRDEFPVIFKINRHGRPGARGGGNSIFKIKQFVGSVFGILKLLGDKL